MTFIDIELTDEQRGMMSNTRPADWFTQFVFRNAVSPENPSWTGLLRDNHRKKQELLGDWIEAYTPRRRVLDAFSANGAFSLQALRAGAHEVVGVDFDPGRVQIGNMIATWVSDMIRFETVNVYNIADHFTGRPPFDVTLAFGGLYHVADPPYVLQQLRKVTSAYLILQTSSVLPGPRNRARFVVRGDRTGEGLVSIRGGQGVWKFSIPCLREMLVHGGFEIVEERRPRLRDRRRFPWLCVVARCV